MCAAYSLPEQAIRLVLFLLDVLHDRCRPQFFCPASSGTIEPTQLELKIKKQLLKLILK
jgi:hypothetical protein